MLTSVLATTDQPRSVTNFFEWYTHALDEQREDFDQNQKPAFLRDFDERLKTGSGSIVPPYLAERLAALRTANKLQVRLTDMSLAAEVGATINGEDGSEAILLHLGNNETLQEHTFNHEGLHTLEGKTQPDGEGEDGSLAKNRGLYRLFGPGKGGEMMNEATIEHMADSLMHGNLEITDPLSAERKNSTQYMDNQAMQHILCVGGLHPISPRLFSEALFEDGSAEESPAIQLLAKQLESAFPGMHVVERIRDMDATKDVLEFTAEFVIDWLGVRSERQTLANQDSSKPPQAVTPGAEVPTTSPWRSAGPTSGSKEAFEQLIYMPGFEQVLLRFLTNSQGTVTESKPPRSVADPAVVKSIDIEAAKLREQGKSEKSVYRTLAKQYHSDVNNKPEAAEKMRVVSTRLESINREEGRRTRQAEESSAEKVVA
jgi:hypothetical protein